MKTAAYDFILPFFVATDELRPIMQQIHLHTNGFLYATDSHMCIKVSATNCHHTYQPVPGYPNAESVFEQYQYAQSGQIKTDHLIELLSNYKWMRETDSITCKKCDGEGEIECPECNHSHTCERCKGSGEINTGPVECSLLVSQDQFAVIKIASKLFRVSFIHTLVISAKMLNAEYITYFFDENAETPGIFQVAEAQILICPKTPRDDDEYCEVRFTH